MTQNFLFEIVDGGEGCMRDDCMVEITSGQTTLVHNPMTYDGQGNPINGNKNITTTNKYCKACGKRWTETL
jgi:hypothetical protein